MNDVPNSTIVRTFAATPEAVFDAWVTPASFAAWWGGSGVEVPLDSVEMDVRDGGTWKAKMILGADNPDTPEINWFGEFVEVDRPNRLVLTLADRPGDERGHVTVTFAAVDGGTEMRFRQTGGPMTQEEYDRTTAGWQTFFEAMDAIVTP
jgi:uncharacterized protein YndB with AHSA1/START domain